MCRCPVEHGDRGLANRDDCGLPLADPFAQPQRTEGQDDGLLTIRESDLNRGVVPDVSVQQPPDAVTLADELGCDGVKILASAVAEMSAAGITPLPNQPI